jgi:DNA replication protein DnaC
MIMPRFADKTFDNFTIETPAMQEALDAARWLVDNPDSGTPGAIFIGGNGTGKNHLACAVAREMVLKHGKTALITKIWKLDLAIKESWRKDGFESEAIKSFVAPDFLVIDEIGLQRGSETELINLSRVIDERYEAMTPTILIGNTTWVEMKGFIGERAADRFREGGKLVHFTWPSWRGRK